MPDSAERFWMQMGSDGGPHYKMEPMTFAEPDPPNLWNPEFGQIQRSSNNIEGDHYFGICRSSYADISGNYMYAVIGEGEENGGEARAAGTGAAAATAGTAFDGCPLRGTDSISGKAPTAPLTEAEAEYLETKFAPYGYSLRMGCYDMASAERRIYWLVNNPTILNPIIDEIALDVQRSGLPATDRRRIQLPSNLGANPEQQVASVRLTREMLIEIRDQNTSWSANQRAQDQDDRMSSKFWWQMGGMGLIFLAATWFGSWLNGRRMDKVGNRQADLSGANVRPEDIVVNDFDVQRRQWRERGTFDRPYIDMDGKLGEIINTVFRPQADQNNYSSTGASRAGKTVSSREGLAQLLVINQMSDAQRTEFYRNATVRMTQTEAAEYVRITNANLEVLKSSMAARGYTKGVKLFFLDINKLSANSAIWAGKDAKIFVEKVMGPLEKLTNEGYKVILFIDEIQMASDGSVFSGRVALRDRIKLAAEANPHISLGIATTVNELAEAIGSDPATLNRYNPVFHDAASPQKAVNILSLRPYVKATYGVESISPEALKAIYLLGPRVSPRPSAFTSAESYFMDVLSAAQNQGVKDITLDFVFRHYDTNHAQTSGVRGPLTAENLNALFTYETTEITQENDRDRAKLRVVEENAGGATRVTRHWWEGQEAPPTQAGERAAGTNAAIDEMVRRIMGGSRDIPPNILMYVIRYKQTHGGTDSRLTEPEVRAAVEAMARGERPEAPSRGRTPPSSGTPPEGTPPAAPGGSGPDDEDPTAGATDGSGGTPSGSAPQGGAAHYDIGYDPSLIYPTPASVAAQTDDVTHIPTSVVSYPQYTTQIDDVVFLTTMPPVSTDDDDHSAPAFPFTMPAPVTTGARAASGSVAGTRIFDLLFGEPAYAYAGAQAAGSGTRPVSGTASDPVSGTAYRMAEGPANMSPPSPLTPREGPSAAEWARIAASNPAGALPGSILAMMLGDLPIVGLERLIGSENIEPVRLAYGQFVNFPASQIVAQRIATGMSIMDIIRNPATFDEIRGAIGNFYAVTSLITEPLMAGTGHSLGEMAAQGPVGYAASFAAPMAAYSAATSFGQTLIGALESIGATDAAGALTKLGKFVPAVGYALLAHDLGKALVPVIDRALQGAVVALGASADIGHLNTLIAQRIYDNNEWYVFEAFGYEVGHLARPTDDNFMSAGYVLAQSSQQEIDSARANIENEDIAVAEARRAAVQGIIFELVREEMQNTSSDYNGSYPAQFDMHYIQARLEGRLQDILSSTYPAGAESSAVNIMENMLGRSEPQEIIAEIRSEIPNERLANQSINYALRQQLENLGQMRLLGQSPQAGNPDADSPFRTDTFRSAVRDGNAASLALNMIHFNYSYAGQSVSFEEMYEGLADGIQIYNQMRRLSYILPSADVEGEYIVVPDGYWSSQDMNDGLVRRIPYTETVVINTDSDAYKTLMTGSLITIAAAVDAGQNGA